MTIGEIIKSYREKNGISMDSFSEISGISKAYISMLERNYNPKSGKGIVPSIKLIKQVSDAIGSSFNDVFNMLDGNVILSDKIEADNEIDNSLKTIEVNEHEDLVITEYRKQPKAQPFIDKILGIKRKKEESQLIEADKNEAKVELKSGLEEFMENPVVASYVKPPVGKLTKIKEGLYHDERDYYYYEIASYGGGVTLHGGIPREQYEAEDDDLDEDLLIGRSSNPKR